MQQLFIARLNIGMIVNSIQGKWDACCGRSKKISLDKVALDLLEGRGCGVEFLSPSSK